MKNIVLSAVAVLAMSSLAVAGGDIAPVEEPVVVPEPVAPAVGGFYLGLAYGFQTVSITDTFDTANNGSLERKILDEDFGSIMIQAGYDFNQYVGIEGRYWFGLASDSALGRGSVGENINADVTVDAYGIYVKPQYPVSEAFNIYALLGYGNTDLSVDGDVYKFVSDSADGFSWGLGAEYRFTDSVGIFIDYVSIYNSSDDFIDTNNVNLSEDETVDTVNFGVNYRF